LGDVLVSPSELVFPQTKVGTVSGDLTLLFQNTGSFDVTAPILLTGPNAGDFRGLDSCLAIPAQQTCAAPVLFAPTDVGLRTATLIVQRPNGETVTVSLTGTGT